MELREYQTDVIEEARKSFRRGTRKLIIQAPTGAGKTVIASQIIRQAEERGSEVLFLAHRRELVYQAYDKLKVFGVDRGVLMAGEVYDAWAPVTVASIDTLRTRAMRGQKMGMPKARLVIIDECHRSLSKTYLDLIDYYAGEGAIVMGLTATPVRGDGRGLGQVYEDMVQCPSVAELIKQGHLVQPEYYAPTVPDLSGVKTQAGDYHKAQLEGVMNTNDLVGDVITNWLRLASDRQTIVFASGVQHSIHLRNEFQKAGVEAAHIDAETSVDDRIRIIEDLRSKKIQVICNCMVLTEGFDEPSLDCAVLAKPTKNLGLYLQMAGRVLRPSPGKENTRIIDHTGAVYRHGFVEDPIEWTLDDGKLFEERERQVRKAREQRKTITCIKCATIYTGQLTCPQCKYTPERRGNYVDTRHADLHRVDEKEKKAFQKQWSTEEKRHWYRMLKGYARIHGYKPGWAWHKYRVKFDGLKPPTQWAQDGPLQPSRECEAWIRHLNIKAAKGKEAREKREREAGHQSMGTG